MMEKIKKTLLQIETHTLLVHRTLFHAREKLVDYKMCKKRDKLMMVTYRKNSELWLIGLISIISTVIKKFQKIFIY